MRVFVGVIVLLLFVSCKEKKIVLQEDFIFTSTDWGQMKSLKFVNDTVFIAYNYPQKLYVYYYLLNDNEKTKINSYLDILKVKDYNTEYIKDGLVCGSAYQFEFIERNKKIFVYGAESEEIQLLNSFSDYLYFVDKTKKESVYWDLDIDFGNTDVFHEPEPPMEFIQDWDSEDIN